jgi:hypothetical protein
VFRFTGLAPAAYTLTVERIGFAPQRMVQIEIRPERELIVRVELVPAEGAVQAAEDRMAPAALRPIGTGQWVPRYAIQNLRGQTGRLWEAGRFSSTLGDHFAAEGLPVWLSSIAVDGMPFRTVSASSTDRAVTGTAFATTAFDAAQVIGNPLDTEWSGAAASVLSAYTMRGSSEPHGSLTGYWSGDALSASSDSDAAYSDVRGGAALRGALSGGTFSIGVDARREQLPVSAAWRDPEGAQALVDIDAGLEAYRAGAARSTTAVTGFARLDLPMSEVHQFTFSGHAATLPAFDIIGPTGAITEHNGVDLMANAALLSLFGEANNELRVSITSSERASTDENGDSLPLTSIAHEGLVFGTSPRFDSVREHHVRVSDAVHYSIGPHALKVGGSIMTSGYRFGAGLQRGQYSYGDIDQFAAATGVFARTEGAEGELDWTDRTWALFAQDRFMVASQLEVMAGVRVERQTLPVTVERDAEWEILTGLVNDVVEEPGVRLSPRASVIWNAGGSGQWLLSAGGGIYYDRLDPLLLASWQHDDGSLDVRRVVGTVAWPPEDETGGLVTSRLTLLGSGIEAPRTLRLTGGVSTVIAGTQLELSGVVRRTENLARRVDLNLVQLPAARDQHGRAVYGTLVKQGGLVAAEPGSNRRFTTYDEVAAIITDRTSEHWGVSAGIERGLAASLGLVARYTFGRTTDDWFGARDGGWYMAAPTGLDQDSTWTDGTSDLDVPHRFVAGFLWIGPADVRVGAAFRLQSGQPFTPGFRDGVDVNADGVPGNDPAFVDDGIAGMDALMSRWPCLRASAGGFARRNACHADPVHDFDVNLAVPLVRFGAGAASAHIDVFDILESSRATPDAALYLVDPAADVTTDPIARTVTLPLIANDNFGEPLTGRQPGRTIRLGISINW